MLIRTYVIDEFDLTRQTQSILKMGFLERWKNFKKEISLRI
jgi:hypothetical protein